MAKYLSLFILLIVCLSPVYAHSRDINALLARLDSAINNEDVFVQEKIRKINYIKEKRKKVITLEEKYWSNSQLYDEYYVFDADSAMYYATQNLEIAKQVNNKQWENEWHINKSFVFSVIGLLNDAKEELAVINSTELTNANKIKYYGQLAYLYSHIGQLSDHVVIGNEDNDRISHQYEDSVLSFIKKDNPEFLWYAASSKIDKKDIPSQYIKPLKACVDACGFNSRTDAMNCYILSQLYERIGDRENRIKYLILSGITDVSIANRDIASLTVLASLMLEDGDLDHAFKYINYSQKQALLLPNRVRAASLAKTVAEINQLHESKLKDTQLSLTVSLIISLVILIALAMFIIMFRRRSGQLQKSKKELTLANDTLTRQMQELSESRDEQERLISELRRVSEHNKAISQTLSEANYLKEECIGATLALCSDNIARFDKYRSDALKLVRAQKWDDLQDELMKSFRLNRELKNFYESFDTLILNIFPKFVRDFNELLRPEERVEPAPGSLTTELRIYALVRLGISDSVKIAKLLHYSTQTVYNYRLRMRNKAIIDKEEFADTVKSLGKLTDINYQ